MADNKENYGHQPQPGYPPQNAGYPPQNPGYPPQNPGYPPQNPGYPPQNPGYPPQNPGYPSSGQGYAPPPGLNEKGSPPQSYQNPGYPSNPQGYAPPPGLNNPTPQGYQQPKDYSQTDYHGAPQQGFVPLVPGGAPYGQVLPPPSQHVPISPIEDDEPMVKGFEFSDETIRRGFIRKVYSILTIQLFITFGFVALIGYHDGTHRWVSQNIELFWVALVFVFVSLICLSCCESMRRTAPHNFIMLLIFTLGESYMVGLCTLRYPRETVALAVLLTGVVCLALTIFAIQTKWDFTMMGGVLFIAVLLLFTFSILAIFIRSQTFVLLLSCIGALVFGIYLIYDTQLIVGGKHKYTLSPEEYIFGALTLYLDIINIFLYILQILGSSKD